MIVPQNIAYTLRKHICQTEIQTHLHNHNLTQFAIWELLRLFHESEDKLLGQSVLGLWHLFVVLIVSFADLPVHTCQDSQNIVPFRAAQKT